MNLLKNKQNKYVITKNDFGNGGFCWRDGCCVGCFWGSCSEADAVGQAICWRRSEVAVRYEIYHALTLLFIGILMERFANTSLLNKAALCMLIGIVLFSGSVYTLALTPIRAVGFVTPIGGLFFMAGWGSCFGGLSNPVPHLLNKKGVLKDGYFFIAEFSFPVRGCKTYCSACCIYGIGNYGDYFILLVFLSGRIERHGDLSFSTNSNRIAGPAFGCCATARYLNVGNDQWFGSFVGEFIRMLHYIALVISPKSCVAFSHTITGPEVLAGVAV